MNIQLISNHCLGKIIKYKFGLDHSYPAARIARLFGKSKMRADVLSFPEKHRMAFDAFLHIRVRGEQ